VLGNHPLGAQEPLTNPTVGIQRLITDNPKHPYAQIGIENLIEALTAFQALCQASGYPLKGTLEQNWLLPTVVGAIRPTCLAPETMIAGDLSSEESMLLVGFEGYHDFIPNYAAANLAAQGFRASAATIAPPSIRSRRRVDAMILAHLFDQAEFRAEVAQALKPYLGSESRIGFPAVLGLKNPIEVLRDLESLLGRRVFEMPGLPPSIPGIRLHNLLVSEIQKAGGRVENGMEVVAFSVEKGVENNQINSVWTESAARRTPHPARHFILATGGFLGDGFIVHHTGYAHEAIFDLPIQEIPPQGEWFQPSFFPNQGHPLLMTGIGVDGDFRPVDQHGKAIYENLAVIGSSLGDGDFIRERSLEGVALASGFLAGMREGAR